MWQSSPIIKIQINLRNEAKDGQISKEENNDLNFPINAKTEVSKFYKVKQQKKLQGFYTLSKVSALPKLPAPYSSYVHLTK